MLNYFLKWFIIPTGKICKKYAQAKLARLSTNDQLSIKVMLDSTHTIVFYQNPFTIQIRASQPFSNCPHFCISFSKKNFNSVTPSHPHTFDFTNQVRGIYVEGYRPDASYAWLDQLVMCFSNSLLLHLQLWDSFPT